MYKPLIRSVIGAYACNETDWKNVQKKLKKQLTGCRPFAIVEAHTVKHKLQK